jgi:hypothetical protein
VQISAFVSEAASLYAISELLPSHVTDEFVQEWVALESRALEPNVYLSPHFSLPAIKHLAPELKPSIIAIYSRQLDRSRLVGLAIVVLCPPRRDFPFKHLMCFESIHSFLSGILLDRDVAVPAANKFFEYLLKPGAPWHGLRINNWRGSGVQGDVMHAAAKSHGVKWCQAQSFNRAVLEPASVNETAYQTSYTAAGGKDMDRRVRRLRELGEVSTRVLRGSQVTDDTVACFLALEDREWARQTKTSLIAAGHETFFKDLCRPMIDESRVFVSEILINGRPVASTFNFIAGNYGFAFKIGWDQSLAKMSPGIINELWFMRDASTSCNELRQIDSGASAGSFIEKIWPGRTTISSGIFITSSRANWVTRGLEVARKARSKIQRLRGK